MHFCRYAIKILCGSPLIHRMRYAARIFVAGFLVVASPFSAYAVLDGTYQTANGPQTCEQSWPVNCNVGSNGSAECGGWNVLKDLAEAESLPGAPQNTCSTGVRIALPDAQQTQGQPVGAMFPGTVIFAQAGKARDGHDYGGVMVIQLKLTDGSPQCFLRYMFLDRRDMAEVGKEVFSGQRIGSIASDDMSNKRDDGKTYTQSRRWWAENWPGLQPQVKIDIGCDEALSNLPHFMPYEPYTGNGTTDADSCPLTKMRFPSPPLVYLANTEYGQLGAGNGNRTCMVGASKNDARYEFKKAAPIDNYERDFKVTGDYVNTVKPRGIIKRKETPVYSVFATPSSRDILFGTTSGKNVISPLFRSFKDLEKTTTVGCVGSSRPDCANMQDLLKGGDPTVTAERVREILTHRSNQFLLGRGMDTNVYEQQEANIEGQLIPLSDFLVERLSAADKNTYNNALNGAKTNGKLNKGKLYTDAGPVIDKVLFASQCQPLHLEPVIRDSYSVRDLLHKSWQELMVEWPQANALQPLSYPKEFPATPINDYVKYPYERINDPSHPFSPRQIFAETERERYSNYGVQCASTPVDIILGSYQKTKADPAVANLQTYGTRDSEFHGCVKCRININEAKEACFADPYSFTNLGGCVKTVSADASGELCAVGTNDMTPEFLEYLHALEDEFNLVRDWLRMTATIESSCNADSVNTSSGAAGMFQFMPDTAASYGINPMDPRAAARASAQYAAGAAAEYNCNPELMVSSYYCGVFGAQQDRDYGIGTCDDAVVPYVAKMKGLLNNPTTGCGSGGGGGGSPSAPSDGIFGDVLGAGNAASTANGNFEPERCPSNYFSSMHLTQGPRTGVTEIKGDQACPAFSNPVPENINQPEDTLSDNSKWSVDWGCRLSGGPNGENLSAAAKQACQTMQAQGNEATKWCPAGRCDRDAQGNQIGMHEGIDFVESGGVPSIGLPVYAAGNGKIESLDRDITIDHSGFCIDKACTQKYPAGTKTTYRHMGGRIKDKLKAGDDVKRCQQIGTVGNQDTAINGNLHFEIRATGGNNKITGNNSSSQTYWAYDVDQPYHTHPGDHSCSGGMADYEGEFGSQGICLFKLPLVYQGKDDLTPPDYFEDRSKADGTFPPVIMPNPASPKKGDKFDRKKPGIVYNGAWRNCESFSGADRTKCEEIDAATRTEDDNKDPDGDDSGNGDGNDNGKENIAATSNGFVNPRPCGAPPAWDQDYGERFGSDGSQFHRGLDIGGGGFPIFASAAGTVTSVTRGYDPWVGSGGSLGNYVQILHDDQMRTEYGHQSQICPEIQPGLRVAQGQVIGYTGNSGGSYGAHLHFNLIKPPYRWGVSSDNGVGTDHVNPLEYIPASKAGAPECALLNDANANKCGDIVDLETGAGVSGSTGKKLCVDKPCTVRYDEADTVSQCAWNEDAGGCGPYGDFSQRGGDCCFNITAPLPSLNMLKIRPGFDNEVPPANWSPNGPAVAGMESPIPGGWKGQRQTSEGGTAVSVDGGAPEGYTFHEFFGDHRPYMRWWDTGAESGQALQEQLLADGDDGKYDALVGVGIEKNSCGIGGWGREIPDGNTSWLELKLYQARSQNNEGLHCIGRYEKLFKKGASEDYALQNAGGDLDTFENNSSGTSTSQIGFPLGWRGYVSDPENNARFPNLKSLTEVAIPPGAATLVGLDNALPGDIIVWDATVTGKSRLPHVAYVVQADNAATNALKIEAEPISKKRWFDPKPKTDRIDTVMIKDYNYGRYPDVCGTTNWSGISVDRTLYKGKLPKNLVDKAAEINLNDLNCSNPDLSSCIENTWGSAKIYRPREHVRN